LLDLKDLSYKPNIEEISAYIGIPLFDEFCKYMNNEYKPICKVEYSKDVWFPGWNIKLKKSGKSLCVIYPKEKYFQVLVVVGKKEKKQVEELLPHLSKEIQEIYRNTEEGNGQRWMMIELNSNNNVYKDTLKLIGIRRESK
jgi:hypothetical protein